MAALQDPVLAPPDSFLREEVDGIIQNFGGIAALCSGEKACVALLTELNMIIIALHRATLRTGEHTECLDRFQDPTAALQTTILPNCCSNSRQCTDWYNGACPKSCAQVRERGLLTL